MKLDDGSIVDLKAIPDCDFAFAAAFLDFCYQYNPVLSDLIQSEPPQYVPPILKQARTNSNVQSFS